MRQNSDINKVSISVRVGGPGGRGAVAPQLWKNFQKSAPFGQILAPIRAKMLVNNGLCVGLPPKFFFPYAYDRKERGTLKHSS